MAKCCYIFCLVWALVISSSTHVRGGTLDSCPNTKTIGDRCKFTETHTSCIKSSAIESTSQLPEEGHFCQNGESSYAQCNGGCLDENNSPKVFEGPDDPMAPFCKSVQMPCKFPFTYNGVSYNKCTNDKLPVVDKTVPEYDVDSTSEPETDEESIFWCATHTDSDSNMLWWGQCDMSECENGETEASALDSLEDNSISVIVNISPESPHNSGISGTINFDQKSKDDPLLIKGTLSGLVPGLHGLHVHELKFDGVDCSSAGSHFNPKQVDHGSTHSETRHAGDFGNIDVDSDGNGKIDLTIPAKSGSTLFGAEDQESILGRTLVIHELEDDLGTLSGSTSETANAESKKTGNAGSRIACALIMRPEDANQPEMMTIIIIVLIVIIVLLLILITALIVYCCKRKGRVSKGKGDDGAPFQNGDMKKKPLEYDELSIPFIDASPAPTPKVGRSTERLSFFRTPSIGRSRGSLSKLPDEDKPAA